VLKQKLRFPLSPWGTSVTQRLRQHGEGGRGKCYRLHSIRQNTRRASKYDDDLLFVGSLARFQRLEDFAQFLERLRIFGTHRLLILTARIGPLQRA